jgi:tetratricopeptide (TPR) repeat protein
MLLDVLGLFWALFFGSLVALVALVVILRVVGKRLQPALLQVRRQAEARMFEATMQSLRALLPQSRWMPLLRGQLLAQMGVLAYQQGDHEQAIELLSQASRRVGDAQLLLAVIRYQQGDKPLALSTLKIAGAFNRRHSLLHNAHAWLLHKEKRVDEAIAVLAGYCKKQAADEIAKDNLLRLQNGKGMSMKAFGAPWYALGFERPPASMGQMQVGRKGFRTPPMRRG